MNAYNLRSVAMRGAGFAVLAIAFFGISAGTADAQWHQPNWSNNNSQFNNRYAMNMGGWQNQNQNYGYGWQNQNQNFGWNGGQFNQFPPVQEFFPQPTVQIPQQFVVTPPKTTFPFFTPAGNGGQFNDSVIVNFRPVKLVPAFVPVPQPTPFYGGWHPPVW